MPINLIVKELEEFKFEPPFSLVFCDWLIKIFPPTKNLILINLSQQGQQAARVLLRHQQLIDKLFQKIMFLLTNF